MALTPPSFRFPHTIPDDAAHPMVIQAIRDSYNAFTDIYSAFPQLKAQIDALKKVTTTTSSGTSTSSSTSTTIITTAFPGLGAVNDQTGNATYTVTSSDNGILLYLNNAAGTTVTLNSGLTIPFFFFVGNAGTGNATLSPSSGSIVGPSSLPQGDYGMVVFNGTNWYVTPIGGTPLHFADDETPSGAINGSNVTFTLANTPNPVASLELFRNGLLQLPGGVDYTLATATITYVSAPLAGDTLTAWYRF